MDAMNTGAGSKVMPWFRAHRGAQLAAIQQSPANANSFTPKGGLLSGLALT
jgi:hypothetical protein